ncbi:hypothetical protein N3K66_008683 [Trichothecium roseum]|uniref:Uncharacterized protein n=1 Tax=Trichothecium roseum TaxID=47278 RepID=A0ACC0UR20_9HYPO|nr:hypothetical protein N3K66_008683 [Trichothecium roseum]
MTQEAGADKYPAKRDTTTPGSRSLYDACVDLRDRVDAFLAEEDPGSEMLKGVQRQLRISMQVVEEVLAKYQFEQISISYNGGKDCLVLLIMILAGLARRYPSPPRPSSTTTNGSSPQFPAELQAVYIVPPDPFPEVDEFVASSSKDYHLEVLRYVLPMRQGLEAYLADRPKVQAIFVGTRRTDPHGEKLTHSDRTDHGWPDFMRIHPVIDWHYAEIWAFIRRIGVPYCPLYDLGYTSLGGVKDTHPNPHLKKEQGKGDGFRPAYELMADDEERLGRDK